MKRLLSLSSLVVIVMFPSVINAQWRLDGAPVCTAAGNQSGQSMVADGAGGINIAWDDTRSGTFDIYVQRVNSSGVGQWTSNGVALCTATNNQVLPVIALDATTGAIVAWDDLRNGNDDIYARRVSSAGVPLWTADGVAICTQSSIQGSPVIVADGSGGAIIAWMDYRNGNWDIYAQRVNSTGVVQWAANGVQVCVAANNQTTPRMVSDGAGGAILVWEDLRAANYDLFVQRINSAGAPQWALNGAAIADLPSNAQYERIVSDGASGAIIAWEDHRNPSSDIFAQRVSAAGASQWTIQGVGVCIAAGAQYEPKIAADGAGGAVITWDDNRAGINYDVYAQKVTSSGSPQWLANGAPVCVLAAGDQQDTAITTDGAGGAIVSWLDGRSNYDLPYAQRLDVAGVAQWTMNGVPLSTVAADQGSPVLQPDGSGNVIAAWTDYRTGISDIYAQRVEGVYGYWGRPDPTLVTVSDIRKDQGGKVALDWKASGRDIPVPETISFYSIWRAVTVSPFNQTAGAQALMPLDRVQRDTPAGTLMKSTASSYYWELVGTEDAFRWPSYSFSADTRADSVAGNTANTYFMVAAHAYDRQDAFPSNVLSGHSVDNLAPVAPLGLAAQRIGNYVHLKWNGVHVADIRDYSVYRKTSTGVTPIPANFLGTAADTVLTDTSPPASAAYYIVTANDVHANQSTKSNEAAVAAATGAGNLPPITALTVLQNHPNPFASVTEFEIGLPAKSDVLVEVYDVAGRKVTTQVLAGQRAGWQSVRLQGIDGAGRALPSGVYFCRITAGGASTTRKFVIAR
jgi:hypothetical protein